MRSVLLLLLLTYPVLSQTGRIQGVVNDDTGAPVAGAYAVATAQSPTDHRTYNSVTGANGAYTLANLPAGRYSLCVQSPGDSHLANCHWSNPTQVTLTAGQTATQNISVTQGALLQIRLHDPRRLIAANDDIFLVVALPSGLYQPMRLASSDANDRVYDVAVPLSAAVRATLISSHLQIADDNGVSLAPASPSGPATSATLNIPAPSSSHPPPRVYTVTGRK